MILRILLLVDLHATSEYLGVRSVPPVRVFRRIAVGVEVCGFVDFWLLITIKVVVVVSIRVLFREVMLVVVSD